MTFCGVLWSVSADRVYWFRLLLRFFVSLHFINEVTRMAEDFYESRRLRPVMLNNDEGFGKSDVISWMGFKETLRDKKPSQCQ